MPGAYKPRGVNRYREQQEEKGHSLAAQASRLPLNELPKWVREAIGAVAEEFEIDPLGVAAIFDLKFRKSQTNHDETNVPDMHRPSEAIYCGDMGGVFWNNERMVMS